jgi:hypothetical protein
MSPTHAATQTGRDTLVCRQCEAEFPEGAATTDDYECPECEKASGIGDGLRRE